LVLLLAYTDAEYWNTGAQNTLRQKLASRALTGKAKNVILFLGDGLSIPTLAAARAYLGQLQGHTGEETVLSFEAFPHTGLSKVKGLNKNKYQGLNFSRQKLRRVLASEIWRPVVW
jgi:alkaline phosphatase